LPDEDSAACPWMVVVPAGNFLMGSPDSEKGRFRDEGPQHTVRIAKPFAVMEAEVTRGQFALFVKEAGYTQKGGSCKWDQLSFAQTDEHPVVCVDWDGAKALATWLSQRTGKPYRLLSEAEWEYAARAGSTTRYYFGDDENDLCRYANVANCKGRVTAPVKNFKPNAFKLYDMTGNAWEWSGCRTAGTIAMPMPQRMARPGKHRVRTIAGCCAAAAGSASQASRAPPSAAGTGRTSATTTRVSVWPGPLRPESLLLYPFSSRQGFRKAMIRAGVRGREPPVNRSAPYF
jgi:formylglycine-generating enzyme required for sulfatase activity